MYFTIKKSTKWIGGSDQDMVLYSHYLPVFRLEYTIQLNEILKSTCAGLVYGANDARLMDKNKNLYHLENGKNESYIKVELDIAPISMKKEAILNVIRMVAHPIDIQYRFFFHGYWSNIQFHFDVRFILPVFQMIQVLIFVHQTCIISSINKTCTSTF